MATGKGADTDTLVASARAYVSALNKLIARQNRPDHQELRAV
jgi:2-isopropylmalate synthase